MRGWLAAARGSGADMGPAAGVPKRRPGLYNNCSPFSFNNVFSFRLPLTRGASRSAARAHLRAK